MRKKGNPNPNKAMITEDSGDIIKAKYENYNFSEGFDIIVSRFNLEHINDLETILPE